MPKYRDLNVRNDKIFCSLSQNCATFYMRKCTSHEQCHRNSKLHYTMFGTEPVASERATNDAIHPFPRSHRVDLDRIKSNQRCSPDVSAFNSSQRFDVVAWVKGHLTCCKYHQRFTFEALIHSQSKTSNIWEMLSTTTCHLVTTVITITLTTAYPAFSMFRYRFCLNII